MWSACNGVIMFRIPKLRKEFFMAKAQKIEKPRAEWGSDVVVDLLKAFEIEYVAINPGATFRGLHDSLVNYGGNHAPEIILCTHEEIAVALAHGYARAKGKPMGAAVHNVVGLQHAIHGDLQCMGRSIARYRHGRHRSDGYGESPSLDRLGAYGARAGQSRPRLRQMGRPAGAVSKRCRSLSFALIDSPPPSPWGPSTSATTVMCRKRS